MAEDSERKDDLIAPSRARRIRDWLMRPRTVGIVGPAAFLLGLALVAIGLLLVPSGDNDRSSVSAPGPTLVPGTAYPVQPEMVEAWRYLVPAVQPSAGFRLVIDSLGVNAPVVRLGLDPRDVPQVPNDGAKVAWYDFSAKPGVPNAYGLVGNEANAIAPGKIPLSSMAPTMVFREGKLFLVLGSPGGSRIITTVAQVILNVIDFHMTIREAVDAPRIHHQWLPDEILAEKRALSPEVIHALEAMGHTIRESSSMGNVQAILIDPIMGLPYGASDSRGVGVDLAQ